MIKINWKSGGPKYNTFEMGMLTLASVSLFAGLLFIHHGYPDEMISMWGIVGMVASGAGIASRRNRGD